MRPVSGKGGVVGLGGKAYGWLKKALGVYGTAVTLVQLLPAAIALAAVFLSPTAWLSATLRRWVLAGALSGTVVGMLLLARSAGLDDLRRLLAGKRIARAKELASLAWWGLGLALVAGTALRLHLATVDVRFVDSFVFLVPLFDFYLGGGRFAGVLYNGLAGVLSAALTAGLVAGGPAALLRWRERRAAYRNLATEEGPLGAIDEAIKALDGAKETLTAAKARMVELKVERDELAARLELAAPREGVALLADGHVPAGSVTTAPDQPALHGPRGDGGRRRR